SSGQKLRGDGDPSPLNLFRTSRTPAPRWVAGVLVRNRLLRCFHDWVYRHVGSPIGFLGKRDRTLREREKRMVFAHADIGAGVPLGPALTHDDVAGEHGLATELLHAKALGFGIATVTRRTTSFLVCHNATP